MTQVSQLTAPATPWEAHWPRSGTERVPRCPICGDERRGILHQRLVDNTFRCAPGAWTLVGCATCRTAYLDPRPTPETIGLAYASYYTHAGGGARKQDYGALGPVRKLRRRLVNGYTNRRFGTAEGPASALGPLVAAVLPTMRRKLEREYRSLPGHSGAPGRLLDLGCGDGAFLAVAARCGWKVEGLDPDPQAAAAAAKRGLAVHTGGIEWFDAQSDLFDVITMNHVIEHLHDPMAVLRACHRLLRPGGTLWLETPNIESPTHSLFGVNWRGLEAPRHLVLFNRHSLYRALVAVGFTSIADCPRPSACSDMYRASYAMRQGLSPYASIRSPLALRIRAQLAASIERLQPDWREFLTVSARKGRP